jgi:uncharacterized glyoxalase superfamily protein PhnB
MPQTITPYLLYEDAEAAIEFATRAFGFREVERHTGGAGGLHAELETPEGGRIYVGQPPRGFRNPSEVGRTCHVYVLVEDVNAQFERARAEGAAIIAEPEDRPFGRLYGCTDPQGHEWYFAQPIAASPS